MLAGRTRSCEYQAAMVTLQRASQRASTFLEKNYREPASSHVHTKESYPSDLESGDDTSFTFTDGDVNKKSFIFEEDYYILVSRIAQEEQGNLFGLWTTEGEAVIHIVCPPTCTTKLHSQTGDDILSNQLPLTHIGNWSYSGIPSLDLCPHQLKPRTKFLDVRVSKSVAFVVSEDGKKRQIEVIGGRSPFKIVEGDLKQITMNGQQDDAGTDLEQAMKHLNLVTKAVSGKRQERLTFPDVEDPITTCTSYDIARLENPMYLGTRGFQREFAANRQDFKVFMFEEDYQMMQNLVFGYPHLETGGDLFGLWTTEGNAVLHVVLGPGQNCKRTGVSFYQDVPYLKENGELLTQDYMLCHIGEWHSHHQLHLFQPSGGDSSTVIRNYPRGVCGFLLIIANILSSQKVQLSPYLYTETSTYGFEREGKIVRLRAPNAFNKIYKIRNKAENGKERHTYSPGGSRFHRISEYATDSHELKRYPIQTVTSQMKRQPSERRRYTFQHRTPKPYELPTHKPTLYSNQIIRYPHQVVLQQEKNRRKRAKLEDRPRWK